MIDLTFVHKLESALDDAMSTAIAGAAQDNTSYGTCDELIRKICKNAAQRLFFELDGKALLDLGLAKIAAERQAASAEAEAPQDAQAA